MEEARYFVTLGPGGRSKVYRMDGTPVKGTGDSFETSGSPIKGDNMSSNMSVNEALTKIDRLKRRVQELKGEEPDSGGSTPAFKPTQPYYAENEGDEDAENEAETVETGGQQFAATTPYYEDN